MSKPVLRTKRFVLDSFRESDANALFRYRSAPAVSRYQGWAPSCIEEAEAFVARVMAAEFDTPDAWYQFAIRESSSAPSDDPVLIGDLGVHFGPVGSREVEVGVTVAPAWQRLGVARECLSALLEHLFEDRNKTTVFAAIDPENAPVRGLLRRLGFQQRAEQGAHPWYSEASEDLWFAVTHEEWRSSH